MKIDSHIIREIQLFKYYRLVRKWACKTYDLKDADLELIIFLDCLGRFTREDFKNGTYNYSWDKLRWDRLRREGWIDVWRHRNRTTMKYSIYQPSTKAKHLVMRIYRILLGEEDIPTGETNVFYKNKTYTDKVFNKSIEDMIKDTER